MKLIQKVTTIENNVRMQRYFFLKKILFLRKERAVNYRKTFLFNLCISSHYNDINCFNNCLDYDKIFNIESNLKEACVNIDIIIPIYNGFEYLSDLFDSIYYNTDLAYRIIAIDDCSPDPRIYDFLKTQKKRFKDKILILQNQENLGFIKSVNRGLAEATAHVCLLNTDTILPKNWASRLFLPILKDDKVASVTPFSNAATIFSLPVINKDNIFSGNLEDINKSLSKIKTQPKIHFPTGVGFCMAMNKDVIDKIGHLDEIFTKGYGEENDWCQKAVKLGYYNTIAGNLFVWHKHGGSFISEEKMALIKNNIKIIKKRYPNYLKDVQTLINNKTYKSLHFLAEVLYFSSCAQDILIWFDHTWRGGTEVYTFKQIEKLKKNCLILRCQENSCEQVQLTYFFDDYKDSINFSYQDLFILASNLRISKIVLNNIAGYADTQKTLEYINKLKVNCNAKVAFHGHDFQCICPNITMLNYNTVYCDFKNFDKCSHCFSSMQKPLITTKSIQDYQKAWNDFLHTTVDEIIVFSNATKDILHRAFPRIENKISVIPHTVSTLQKVNILKHSKINVAVLGGISVAKGANILKEIDKLLPYYPNVKFIIVGNCIYRFKNIKVFGKYTPTDLPHIMEENLIDMVFIPSIWPETFSYTASEAMNMGLPTACFNIGAPPERVGLYNQGLVINKIDGKYALERIVDFVINLRKGNKA